MANRRRFLQTLSTLPLAGGAASAGPARGRDFFAELGIRPFINAAGTFTTMTASLMPPQVMAAHERPRANSSSCNETAGCGGREIATMIGANPPWSPAAPPGPLPSAPPPASPARTRTRSCKSPTSSGMKNEVLVQKYHRYGYDHAVRTCGVSMVEVETRRGIRQEPRPADRHDALRQLTRARRAASTMQLGGPREEAGIPTFNDSTADVTHRLRPSTSTQNRFRPRHLLRRQGHLRPAERRHSPRTQGPHRSRQA